MEKIIKRLLPLFCSILFATGCMPKLIIDDVQLIQAAVFDTDKNDRFKVTFVCPIQQKGNKVQIFSGSGNVIKEVKVNANLESAQPFASGQMRVALFTTELAKRGLSSSLDTILRDVTIGNLLYVGLLEGDGQELLSGKYSTSANVAIYIKKMLEHNMKTGPLPKDNLHMTAYRYYRDGQDTYMPILKKHKDKIRITGMALLKRDKYVGKIKSDDLFVFKGLLEKHKLDSREFKTSFGHVMINDIRSKPTYYVDIKNGKPSFLIKVKMDARILELSEQINLDQEKNVQKINTSVEKQLEKQAAKLIKKFKLLGVDPLGLGAKYRQRYRPFQLKEWEKMYKDVPVKVDYEVDITNSGTIE